jgi:hypothetical protein
MCLYTIDYATVLYGGAMNQNCCTAAARAAASGPPTNYCANRSDTPQARATAVITGMAQPNPIVRMQSQVRLRETFSGNVPSAPFGGPFTGTCTIKTRCDVYPPFALPFVDKNVPLYTSQTFPWTWTMPTAYSPAGVGGGAATNGNSGPYSDITQSLPPA